MNTKLVPLISRPCSQDWKAMTGDAQRRFCEHCQLHVHNLSAMSPAERETLLAQRGERQCIAYVDSPDSIRVQRGTWLFIQRLLRPWRAGVALFTLLVSLFTAGCATTHDPCPLPPPASHDCTPANPGPDGKYWVGGITSSPPLWRRILFFWKR
ncbi:MAG: hypothetical protein ABJF10_23435 [Chthoniobacter sp.]|uniref:hypothetical protein n=1 Tax=Chthoniobacter sp. TaxID=2510640 RepID=UPI0032A7B2B8